MIKYERMPFSTLLCLLAILGSYLAMPVSADCPNIISRSGWEAKTAKYVSYMIIPVKYVIIQHTATPRCTSISKCAERMVNIQFYHMNNLKYDDIGYSFVVGGDGNVYEGRGWHKDGAHSRGYNTKALGIALVGDFRESLPPRAQLDAVKKLLDCGVELGRLTPDFKLLGHRQVIATESPGLALFQEIKTWPQWVEKP